MDMEQEVTNQDKLTKWKNEPTVDNLKSDLHQATSTHGEQMAMIEHWNSLRNVTSADTPNKRCGRSSVQPKLVRKQAEWRYSALSEPFLNNDDIFSVTPRTYRDREAALQNGLVLNYQFNNQIDKVNFIDRYVRADVDDGTVIVRTGWEYEEREVTKLVPYYEYDEVRDPFLIARITEAQQLYMNNDVKFHMLSTQLQESVLASMENDRPIKAVTVGTEEITLTEIVKNQPTVTVCNPRNVIVDPTCNGDYEKANFIIYSYETSLSDLRKLGGYENLDEVEALGNSMGQDSNHVTLNTSFNYEDEPRKKYVAYEYWGYWDIDNSGMTKPIVAVWIGETMVRMQENPFPDGGLPFVIVPYLPVVGSVYGEPDAPLLEDNQKLIGALTRGMVDSMARSANAQIGMRKDALDGVNKRKFKTGQDYEFNPNVDPRAAVIEHSYPELPASTFNMLQMFGFEAESLTGVKSFSGGLSGDALGKTATGIQGVLDAAGKRELAILRRLADGLEKVAKKILAMNAVWLSDEETIRITDEDFVSINRDNLVGSFDIKLSVSTAESDNIKAQELAFMLQTTSAVLPFEMTQTILTEIARLRNMPDLSKLIKEFKPQPDPKAELESQNLQLENQKLQAELQLVQADIQLKQAQIQRELANAKKMTTEANLNDLDFVEQESGVKQERELEIQQAQAQGNMKRDITKSVLDSQLKAKDTNNVSGTK